MPLPSAPGSALLRTFTLLAVTGSVAVFAGCGGDDASDSGDSGGSGDAGITATSGDQIFKDANCSSCHTLAAADAKGAIGPNLDEVKPSADTVKEYVTNGEGSMPAFSGRLSAAQIQAVSDYVAEVAGQ
ncbi:MAG: cytochrome c [Solirubrobacteraceae bacterium]|nr:cytochrome c [Solirubrobacteraceae bacterium]